MKHSHIDKVVKPIVVYGSEAWGFKNYHMVEKVHLKFCKLLLNLKTSTANCLVYGELELFPCLLISDREWFLIGQNLCQVNRLNYVLLLIN